MRVARLASGGRRGHLLERYRWACCDGSGAEREHVTTDLVKDSEFFARDAPEKGVVGLVKPLNLVRGEHRSDASARPKSAFPCVACEADGLVVEEEGLDVEGPRAHLGCAGTSPP